MKRVRYDGIESRGIVDAKSVDDNPLVVTPNQADFYIRPEDDPGAEPGQIVFRQWSETRVRPICPDCGEKTLVGEEGVICTHCEHLIEIDGPTPRRMRTSLRRHLSCEGV